MFGLYNLDRYIESFNGYRSKIMELLEDRIINFCKDKKSGFHEDEHYMLYEFCLFEDDYFRIKKDIIENNLRSNVVDIGCQCGFQSEIFIDTNKYIGIECGHNYFFNNENSKTQYIIDKFPNCSIDLSDKITISNMSLGYFNNFLGEEWNKEKNVLTKIDNELITELSKSKILYCNSRPAFINELKSRYNNYKFMGRDSDTQVSTGVYKFWN